MVPHFLDGVTTVSCSWFLTRICIYKNYWSSVFFISLNFNISHYSVLKSSFLVFFCVVCCFVVCFVVSRVLCHRFWVPPSDVGVPFCNEVSRKEPSCYQETVDIVNEFKYLGIVFKNNGRFLSAIKLIKAQANKAM